MLVSGATRGIGRAISQAFAEQGAKVALNFRSDLKSAEKTISNLTGDGHCLVQTDISCADNIPDLIDTTTGKLGGLDILVNNAGIGIYHPIATSSYEEWQKAWQQTLATNLFAASNLSFCAAKTMMDNGGGRIVNVSSRGAFRGEPDKPAYGASKAGLNALGQSLAIALAPHNIFVGTVAPGFVETDLAAERLAGPEGDSIRAQSPLGRVARAEEVARAVLFLAADGSEFMTGTIIDVNGASYLRT
ncbi:MAG: SDR family oxidoreductase [Gammaproteobacteria bacterium]|nr:SDR family oxidoreductase [Gammaproteobacteria bacterium]